MSQALHAGLFAGRILADAPVVIDVRSPSEFAHAHIPGAHSLPLLDDEARRQVGIAFRREGRQAAVVKGFDLVGGNFGTYIRDALHLAGDKNVLLYCWRGGMRSGIVSWLLAQAGFRVTTLQGGYKAFRNWVLNQLEQEKKLLVVGGKTGSGKTELLRLLEQAGEQVIDLEALACHKGSAFGSLGQPPQPGNEQFENSLAMRWAAADSHRTLWIENESRLIGSCLLPLSVYSQMRKAPVAEIVLDKRIRLSRILEEYGRFPAGQLRDKTDLVKKRLGGLLHRQAVDALDEGRLEDWAGILLDYYDRTYAHSNSQRESSTVRRIELPDDDWQQHIFRFLALSGNTVNSPDLHDGTYGR